MILCFTTKVMIDDAMGTKGIFFMRHAGMWLVGMIRDSTVQINRVMDGNCHITSKGVEKMGVHGHPAIHLSY